VTQQKEPTRSNEYCEEYASSDPRFCIAWTNQLPINAVIYLDTVAVRDTTSTERFGIVTAKGRVTAAQSDF
jgi:hypothetical protein